MKFITRDTDYALRALIFMAKRLKESKAEVISVEEIIQRERLPKVFLRGLLQRLAKEGILASYKGKGGGFSFLKSPGEIRLTGIINIFQGPVDLRHCFLGKDICPRRKRCKMRKTIGAINNMVNKELNGITISALI